MREHLEGAALMAQPAHLRQGVTHLLSQAHEQPGVRQVHEYDLLHLFVTQRDGGRQRTIEVAVEITPLAQKVRHAAIAWVVRDGKHILSIGNNGATSAGMPIVRTLCQPIASDKQHGVKFATTGSMRSALRAPQVALARMAPPMHTPALDYALSQGDNNE